MDKNAPMIDPKIEVFKTLLSLESRTFQVEKDNFEIEREFDSKDLFWVNQKKEFDRLMTSLKIDIDNLRKDLSANAMYSEKIIQDFRNKLKKERVDNFKRGLDSWKLEEFVTQKRFLELLEKEMRNL